jgi:Ca2+-binding RTX toxin-like protein
MHKRLTVIAICALASASVAWAGPSQAATPTCFGKSATMVGTAGDDYLEFGPGDVVYAAGGNDIIVPRDQAQAFVAHICGGAGSDSIRGGRGVDHVHGDGGADSINGGYGGADTLLGDAGDDRIMDFDDFDYPDYDDPGTDIMRGGTGNDVVITACGSDKAYGDAGQDTLTDYTRAKSYLYGGADNDSIDATQNEAGTNPFVADYVSGDRGYDVAVVNQHDTVTSSTERKIYR